MSHHALMALSPLDGRYHTKLQPLCQIFSEFGLIKARCQVEVKWLLTLIHEAKLAGTAQLSADAIHYLEQILEQFSLEDALHIKQIEATTNHDVKAVEYFIKEKMLAHAELTPLVEYIHFGCTSEDINNLAYSLMLQEARQEQLLPQLNALLQQLRSMAHDHADLAMLARTHGQAATPTTVGKEMANFVSRLERQMQQLADCPIFAKLNGATGNYSALIAALPQIDWQTICSQFITRLGLVPNLYTTQIEPHDGLAEIFAILARINTILIDFCRDMWAYIAIQYFTQKPKAGEVGSSTMPHKVNPIDFENAEGNLGLANALLSHMQHKLPISRWQRDLSDSTVLRNIGVALGYGVLAYQSALKGCQKVSPNQHQLAADLDAHWEVLAEPIQTMMRAEGMDEPYEKLKALTRGKTMTPDLLQQFINHLDLSAESKTRLQAMTPATYIGLAAILAKRI